MPDYNYALTRVFDMPWRLFLYALFITVVWIVRTKDGSPSFEFSKRQKADRSIATRYAWITSVVYGIVYGIYNAAFLGIRFADDTAGPLLGVLLSFAVFLFTAAARDALFPFRSRNTILNCVTFIVMGVLWSILYLVRAKGRGDFTHGIITAGMLELFVALLVTLLGQPRTNH